MLLRFNVSLLCGFLIYSELHDDWKDHTVLHSSELVGGRKRETSQHHLL